MHGREGRGGWDLSAGGPFRDHSFYAASAPAEKNCGGGHIGNQISSSAKALKTQQVHESEAGGCQRQRVHTHQMQCLEVRCTFPFDCTKGLSSRHAVYRLYHSTDSHVCTDALTASLDLAFLCRKRGKWGGLEVRTDARDSLNITPQVAHKPAAVHSILRALERMESGAYSGVPRALTSVLWPSPFVRFCHVLRFFPQKNWE